MGCAADPVRFSPCISRPRRGYGAGGLDLQCSPEIRRRIEEGGRSRSRGAVLGSQVRAQAMSTDIKSEELISRWIEANPHKQGEAEAWVLPAHVSVWALIAQLELDGWDLTGVADWYELPVEAVEAAAAYYRRHRAEIDARIARNRAFFAAR